MIAERARNLVALIERRKELQAHVELLDGFQARDQQLEAAVEALHPLVVAALALRRSDISVIDVADRLPGVASQLQRVREVFEKERGSFVHAQRSGFADFERTVSAFRDELETRVREAWRNHTATKAKPLDPAVLRVLGSIGAYEEPVRRLRNLDQEVQRLREMLPSDEVCQRFQCAVKDRQDLWQEMQGDDFSMEILRFLQAASDHGAPLDAFTAAVQQWIANHDLEDSFRVTAVSRSGSV